MSYLIKLRFVAAYVLLMLTNVSLFGQNQLTPMEGLFSIPKSYVVQHSKQSLSIDGKLDEAAWAAAAWTSSFIDIEGDHMPRPTYNTRVKMLWNDSTLFIAAILDEPHIWATQRNHDDIIFKDNDFEIFLDPNNNGHDYFEIEINAFNKIFDLFLNKPYRVGGNALISWNVPGLKSAVSIEGSINDPREADKRWTIEMAVPLKTLSLGHPARLPREGSLWRINFSRVQWDTEISNGKHVKMKGASGRDLPERNWVWSPQGVINMHYPERWGYLQFTKKADSKFTLPYEEKQRQYLWLLYYKQKSHRDKFGKYATTLKALELVEQQTIDGKLNKLQMAATSHQFSAAIGLEGGRLTTINDEGLILTLDKEK